VTYLTFFVSPKVFRRRPGATGSYIEEAYDVRISKHREVCRQFHPLKFFLFKEYRIFVMMTTLTVNINNKKAEKAIKAMLEALGLDYNIAINSSDRPLNKSEQAIYDGMKRSLAQIKLHQEGKLELKTIEEVLAELS
jgi:hypothetical protein